MSKISPFFVFNRSLFVFLSKIFYLSFIDSCFLVIWPLLFLLNHYVLYPLLYLVQNQYFRFEQNGDTGFYFCFHLSLWAIFFVRICYFFQICLFTLLIFFCFYFWIDMFILSEGTFYTILIFILFRKVRKSISFFFKGWIDQLQSMVNY